MYLLYLCYTDIFSSIDRLCYQAGIICKVYLSVYILYLCLADILSNIDRLCCQAGIICKVSFISMLD